MKKGCGSGSKDSILDKKWCLFLIMFLLLAMTAIIVVGFLGKLGVL